MLLVTLVILGQNSTNTFKKYLSGVLICGDQCIVYVFQTVLILALLPTNPCSITKVSFKNNVLDVNSLLDFALTYSFL